MKALSIEINGCPHCLAGLSNGGVKAYVVWYIDPDGSLFSLLVLGTDPITGEKAVWPSASLFLGDEVTIKVVDTDDASPAEVSWE
jgi:hypothetical protein